MEMVLIADDIAVNRKILVEILGEEYKTLEACDGEQALGIATERAHDISLILLDIIMPKLDGYELLRMLKSNRATQHIPVILITSLDSPTDESRGLSEGAIDYITKPFNPHIVKCRVRNHMELKRYQDCLQDMVDRRTRKILKMRESLFDSITSIVEHRSLESGQHVRRIRLYCSEQLNYLSGNGLCRDVLDKDNADIIAHASSLHDIGKVAIPDKILMKPGKLTAEEYEIMKTHSLIGSDFIDSLDGTEDEEYIIYSRQICRHHHEKWDGTGYPDRLCGTDIPFSARVVAIADVYDALTSKRIYKPAYSHETAKKIILDERARHFDPMLVDAFENIETRFREIAYSNSDDEMQECKGRRA